ncbi:MoxR family ATPase [Demequina sp. B12]|uniref:AAA family ATPase n=1 Tax=Demequina sp. B12 TaxID=2992757 RepID=UPI00237A57EC|nr:MoxR family ATPase [Demequina sp. B12]MDE0573338.1 MoxR family ATPase [Demequina sp. B12]
MTAPVPAPHELERATEVMHRVRTSMGTVVSGLDHAITATLATVLAQGHLLMEDVPGVGKTTLARAFAASVHGSVGRIQFTPDLLPADVTGVSIYRANDHTFEFRPGPVFANVVIADEINRASPKTQSALLEAMQERSVTVDGTTRELPDPFLVVATQNPIDMEGTYPLPEAQRDRFMTQVSVGYPTPEAEVAMLDGRDNGDPLARLTPVATTEDIATAIATASRVHASVAAKRYIVDIVGATRQHSAIRLGASPRAALQLLAVARASAAMNGRGHVLPEDIKSLATATLAHRVLPTNDARVSGHTSEALIADVLERTPLPGAGAALSHEPTDRGRALSR